MDKGLYTVPVHQGEVLVIRILLPSDECFGKVPALGGLNALQGTGKVKSYEL